MGDAGGLSGTWRMVRVRLGSRHRWTRGPAGQGFRSLQPCPVLGPETALALHTCIGRLVDWYLILFRCAGRKRESLFLSRGIPQMTCEARGTLLNVLDWNCNNLTASKGDAPEGVRFAFVLALQERTSLCR